MFQMLRLHQLLVAAFLLFGSLQAAAQNSNEQVSGTGARSEQRAIHTGPVDLNADVANPYANPPAHRKKPANVQNDEVSPHATLVPAQNHGVPDPANAASTRQSGLTDVQAKTILQQQGYTRIGDLQANPNSIWVWQTDAVKNGQRIRLGIDYRGNLLELGSSRSPCAAPQAGFGRPSPLGTGVGLSESSSCSSR
jgi:hypothetical protein